MLRRSCQEINQNEVHVKNTDYTMLQGDNFYSLLTQYSSHCCMLFASMVPCSRGLGPSYGSPSATAFWTTFFFLFFHKFV